jgi:putative two-component system response regulator
MHADHQAFAFIDPASARPSVPGSAPPVVSPPVADPVILIVDDNPQNLAVLGEILKDDYRILAATSGARALHLMTQSPRPDLVLLDVMMPGIDGYEVLRRMRGIGGMEEAPVIFTTAMVAEEDESLGLEMGAVDYLAKPLRPAIVRARVHTHLSLKRARDRLRFDKCLLEDEVRRRTHEIQLTQDVTIRALARLAETRDNETGNHILRTQDAVHHLATLAGRDPRFELELDDAAIALIAKSAPLHDIGKVGVPDHILLKPGKLTPEEWVTMRQHTTLGADALRRAEADAVEPLPFLQYAKQIALSHHERWDGLGYPEGLSGRVIPLAARIMAIADVFDALMSARVYKPAIPAAKAREIMVAGRGSHFDPDLLEIFLANFESFCAILCRYPDPAPAADAFDGASHG